MKIWLLSMHLILFRLVSFLILVPMLLVSYADIEHRLEMAVWATIPYAAAFFWFG
jgi:hypothetical protein